ncbi:MAG: cation diffusion facilitator family transporter [Eubacteriales bacterium]|nr:cation diffusion facilitator family transporter [Eubacteriales bacterium]
MITLLSRLFIPGHDNDTAPKVRQAYGILTGAVGIFLNFLLFGFKALAGYFSGSIAITADAFNNLSDAGSSLITLIGFKMSGQEADSGHPYGHGRIEYLSGLVVSVLILLMAIELIRSSFSKILHPQAPEFNPVILLILACSVLVKLYMYLYNHQIAKRIGSSAMQATALDSRNDAISTLVVLLASVAGALSGLMIDGWCGLLVGLFVLKSGIGSARDTINPLLGQPPDPAFVRRIRSIVLSHPQVLGLHDLLVHDYGPGRMMISLHAEVPANGNFVELHDLIDNIEKQLQRELSCSAVIHMDPVVTDDPQVLELKKQVTSLVRELDPSITLHDFRAVKGPTHTNVIFDVVVPFRFKMSDSQIREYLTGRIRRLNPTYCAVVTIDKN